MTHEEIAAERTADYKTLGSFLGLAEMVDVIPQHRLRARMKELLHQHRGECSHGVKLDDPAGCIQCAGEPEAVRHTTP